MNFEPLSKDFRMNFERPSNIRRKGHEDCATLPASSFSFTMYLLSKKNTSAVFQLAALKSQHWFFECFDIPRPFSNYCESSKWSKQTKDAQLITRLRHSFLTVVLFTCMFSKNIEKRSVGFVDLCYQSEIRIRKFLKSLRAVDYQHQETEANQNELSLRRLLSFVQSILRI